MPWKARSVMDERVRFISRLLEGERMVDLCREFGISRKTGYKFRERYLSHGVRGLVDASRRPIFHPHKTPEITEESNKNEAADAEAIAEAYDCKLKPPTQTSPEGQAPKVRDHRTPR